MITAAEKRIDRFMVFGIVLSAAQVALVWAFRFLPLYDYPMWLYEVHIMRSIADPILASVYEIVSAPVPNLGFVGPVWLLSHVVSLEAAGKIFLSLCVVGLPWSLRYCVRSVNGGVASWAEYGGFPFSFCYYFFSGQGFFLGLSFLFLAIGFFHRRWETRSMRNLLAGALLAAYLMHALVLLLMVSVFVGYALTSGSRFPRLRDIALALLPTACCAIAYALAFFHRDDADIRWSFWSLGQGVFKSLFLFTRSYGHSNPLPLTVLNTVWLIILAYVAFSTYRLASIQSVRNRQLLFPILICFPFMLFLPATFFGVVQPGVRFGLPLVLFFLIMTSRAKVNEFSKVTFLSVACVVVVYNAFHFNRVDERMQRLHADLESVIDSSGTFSVVRFDWPSEREIGNIGASSVDPLFGAAYYVALERQNVGAIFETALLRLRPDFQHLKPMFEGQTRQEFTSSIIVQRNRFLCFRYLILVGKNQEQERFANAVGELGFQEKKKSEFWRIMAASSRMQLENSR